MNIDEENPVSLELARTLKNLGFNLPTYYYYQDKNLPYSESGLKRVKINSRRMNHNKYDNYIYSAPDFIVAEKWLKRKNLLIF